MQPLRMDECPHRRRGRRCGIAHGRRAMTASGRRGRPADAAIAEGRRHRPARPDEGGPAGAAHGWSTCADVPGPRCRSPRTAAAACASARMVTLAHVAAHPAVRQRYPALADAAAECGQPADPQCRDARRQPAAAAALLVFPRRRRFRCLRKGGGHCFAHRRREPVPRHLRQQAVRHRASLHRRDRARGARRARRAARCRRRHAPRCCWRISSSRPDQDMQRENDLRPREILTAVLLPPAPPACGWRI